MVLREGRPVSGDEAVSVTVHQGPRTRFPPRTLSVHSHPGPGSLRGSTRRVSDPALRRPGEKEMTRGYGCTFRDGPGAERVHSIQSSGLVPPFHDSRGPQSGTQTSLRPRT